MVADVAVAKVRCNGAAATGVVAIVASGADLVLAKTARRVRKRQGSSKQHRNSFSVPLQAKASALMDSRIGRGADNGK